MASTIKEEGRLKDEEDEWREGSSLNKYITGFFPTIFYIPNFVSEDEQTQLLHQIYEVSASRWKFLKNRRLQNWGGVVHEKGLLPQELPPWLKVTTEKIRQHTKLFPSSINHVLINEYLPDQGIMPHQDGPAYFPVVAILSLQSPVVIDFNPHSQLQDVSSKAPCSVLLMPCSLLIFKDEAYSDYLHGIQDNEVHGLDKVVNVSEVQKLNLNGHHQQQSFHRSETRVSLTCRLVLKVHKKLFRF